MAAFAGNRWFKLAELAWFIAVGITWALVPQLWWWFLPIALLPWLLRIIARRFPFKRTRFDFLLLVFLLTAVVGVWAAYDREAALAKFWLLLAGILIYYSLAGQPQENLWIITGMVTAFGAGVAVFFMLTQNWEVNPAKIGLIQRVAVWWMSIRPNISIGNIHHNTAGGMMALTTPLLVALSLIAWQKKKVILGLWSMITGGLITAGLIFSTSRGAWIGLSAGLGFWLFWVISTKLANRINLSPYLTFGLGVMVSSILIWGFIANFPGGVIGLAGELPGADSASSRINLAKNSLKLLGDFPFTGGGLGSFAGLYSQYILDVPFFFFGYSHNLLLDVGIGQGIVGLLSFGIVYLGILLLAIHSLFATPNHPLMLASLASLIVIIIHGLVDNIIYYQAGSLLVFMIPAIIIGCINSLNFQKRNQIVEEYQENNQSRAHQLRWHPLVVSVTVTIALGLIVVLVTNRHTYLSTWYANLGAVQMSKIELSGFPSDQWADGTALLELHPAIEMFRLALDYNPNNRTANHRLGLIAMFGRDYSTAISYLDKANQLDPNHRGILKTLGYSYVWSGEFDLALPYLEDIPEAKKEMRAYIWWWQSQGRGDLANHAFDMVVELDQPQTLRDG